MCNEKVKLTSVRAKFQCNGVMNNGGGQKVVRMNAVYSEKGENKDFAQATPCGGFDMCINENVPASEYFKQGQCYYLDITEAPQE